jgi:hypothetical protein
MANPPLRHATIVSGNYADAGLEKELRDEVKNSGILETLRS